MLWVGAEVWARVGTGVVHGCASIKPLRLGVNYMCHELRLELGCHQVIVCYYCRNQACRLNLRRETQSKLPLANIQPKR
jgi:hypothetical protein